MGAEISQESDIPDNIDSYEKVLQKQWRHNVQVYDIDKDMTFISPMALNYAGILLDKTMKKYNITNLVVLEIMAGNGMASAFVRDKMNMNRVREWHRTDILRYATNSYMTVETMDSIEAIKNYGARSDLLIMICPPPGHLKFDNFETLGPNNSAYGDYYACRNFINNADRVKYIVFIGELGASDGSIGMYKYLMFHPKLCCILRKIISMKEYCFGEPCNKEIFMFQIIG